ncbi:MAG: Uma2 family endonuclease [Deltaproteobacteria bacterium]|nr:Uma2 family endonuclease [Deltaproteobacteria bacterium]
MSGRLADAPLSYEEYLQFEESVDSRHEFIDGDILAMAGGTRRHAVLKSRLSARLTIGLGEGGPCRVEDSDTRVLVERGSSLNAYYPDMVVICGDGRTHPRDPDGGVVNPTLIVEVTSRNTEKRDRGIKLEEYRLIASLREYVIVSHVRQELELWSRTDSDVEWDRRVFKSGETATLHDGIPISVDDLYRAPLPPR